MGELCNNCIELNKGKYNIMSNEAVIVGFLSETASR
jgi:hypothetical protein